MPLIKCKVPPGKGSWLNRFLSDIMNLQNPSSFAGDVWGKVSSATEGKVHREGESLHFLCLRAWQTFPTRPGGAERRSLPSAGRERRRGRDAAIHPPRAPAPQPSAPTPKRAGHSLLAFLSPASFPTQLLHYSPKAKLSKASSARREILPLSTGKNYEAFSSTRILFLMWLSSAESIRMTRVVLY